MNNTPHYETKCEILSQVWETYRDDPAFEEYINFFDLSLPLAYLYVSEIIKEQAGEQLIEQAYQSLLELLNIEDSADYNDLSDLVFRSSAEWLDRDNLA